MDEELITLSKRSERKARAAEYDKALGELADVRARLDETYSRFNAVTPHEPLGRYFCANS